MAHGSRRSHRRSLQARLVPAASARIAFKQASSCYSGNSSIASAFRARTADLNGLSAPMVDSVAASARDALRNVATALNAKYGDTYVFGGQDSTTAPVPQAEAILSSGFFSGISTAVGTLAANGAAATAAATLATASSNAVGTSPFTTTLSQPVAAMCSMGLPAMAPPGISPRPCCCTCLA